MLPVQTILNNTVLKFSFSQQFVILHLSIRIFSQ